VTSPRFAQVVLPLPVATPYTYAVPDALAPRVTPGVRVVVPVRNRKAIGLVVAIDAPAPEAAAKPIADVADQEPVLSGSMLELAQWISRHYGAPLGLTVRAMLPGALWAVGRPAGPPDASVAVLRLERRLPSLLEREQAFARAPKRRVVYEAVEALGGSAPVKHLVEQMGFSRSALDGLVKGGWARIDRLKETRDPFAGLTVAPPAELTADQRRVVEAVVKGEGGKPSLIHGVTGSGKTLVYLEVLRHVVDQGRGAIVLVPEIALTPQTVARVRGVFGDQVAVLHSGLSEGERADAWRALHRGERRVAVGPRSAVFAPVQRLGAIVIDEEHESSYKQGSAPRYHARDVAAVRARLEGAQLILGSATPSLETLHLVETGRITSHSLPQRIGDRPLPPVEVVDLRTAPRVRDSGGVPWSEVLDESVRRALARNEQVILLLNRRGFATYLQCPACGHVPECPNCSIALTVHKTPAGLKCHYCDHTESVPAACVRCGGEAVRTKGLGTQQLERFLSTRYPAARIARMDLDTTSSKWAHHRILERVARKEVDILVGTQMIAKGLDFPDVTVVGVVDADTALHLPDFRAAERTFQLIAQVAGRAGRGPAGGRVLVQTRAPEHHAIRAAARHSVEAFAQIELPLRAAPNPVYPPHCGLARFVVGAGTETRAQESAEKLAGWLHRVNGEHLEGALRVLGPAPCPIPRLQGRWRWHVLVKSDAPAPLGRLVRAWRGRTGVTVDRDPLSLL